MEKRGQVTFFVILGIIIVGSVFMVYVYQDSINDFFSSLRAEEVPEEAKAVQTFIYDCIEDAAMEGIEMVSLQGGYIEIPWDSVPVGNVNMFSNRLNYFSGFETAYWNYQMDNRLDVLNIPEKSFIESQLSVYIEENLDVCLDDFSEFEGFSLRTGEREVRTSIGEDRVKVYVDFPVVGSKGDTGFKFSKFNKEIRTDLGRFYELASDIVEAETDEFFLEEMSLDIMRLYDEVPFTGVDFECVPPMWLFENVKGKYKEYLSFNIPFVKIKGTDYTLANEKHAYFEVDAGKSYEDITVNFFYDENWPFYMEVEPNEDGILRGEQISDMAGDLSGLVKAFYCVNNYHFVYDVKYPVLVTLSSGEEEFNFAMMVVFENNQPRKAEIVPDYIPGPDVAICENRVTEGIVYTYGLENGEETSLDGVDVNFKCIAFNCDIGETENGLLEGLFPFCVNGVVEGRKEGYHFDKGIVSTDESFSADLVLEKIVNLGVDVYAIRADDAPGQPYDDEQVVINLENEDKDYRTILVYPEIKEVGLIPGDYSATIYVLSGSGEEVVIPEKVIEKCVEVPKAGVWSLFTQEKEQKCFKTTIPSMSLSNLITGRSEFEFSVLEDDLEYDKIRFYVYSEKRPVSVEELQSMSFDNKMLKPVFMDE